MIVTIWALVLMISVNLWTYIPKQRPIPRHSDLYIAMMETFDPEGAYLADEIIAMLVLG